MAEMAEPLTPEAWLWAMAAQAYCDAERFLTCGDPWCVEGRGYVQRIIADLATLDAERAARADDGLREAILAALEARYQASNDNVFRAAISLAIGDVKEARTALAAPRDPAPDRADNEPKMTYDEWSAAESARMESQMRAERAARPAPALEAERLHRAIRETLPFEKWISVETAASIGRAYDRG